MHIQISNMQFLFCFVLFFELELETGHVFQEHFSISIIKVILLLCFIPFSEILYASVRGEGSLFPDLRNRTSKHAEIVYFAVYC